MKLIRILKPIRRRTKRIIQGWDEVRKTSFTYSKDYTYLSVSTTIPDLGGEYVLAIIFPLPKGFRVEHANRIRRILRSEKRMEHLKQHHPEIYALYEDYKREAEKEAERIVRLHRKWIKESMEREEVTIPIPLLVRLAKYGETFEEALENVLNAIEGKGKKEG